MKENIEIKIKYSIKGVSGWREATLDLQDEIGVQITEEEGTFFFPWTSILGIKFLKE